MAAKPSSQCELFPGEDADDGVTILTARCRLQRDGEEVVVLVAGAPIGHFRADDLSTKAKVMVMLVGHDWAMQVEVARAFSCDVRTVRRAQECYDEGGLAALGRPDGYPKGRCHDRACDRKVAELKAASCFNREIARRLGCDEKAVRKRLRRLGWQERKPEQAVLPILHPGRQVRTQTVRSAARIQSRIQAQACGPKPVRFDVRICDATSPPHHGRVRPPERRSRCAVLS